MLPDCIAMITSEAKLALNAAGISEIELVITQPPRGGTPLGETRVVRQRQLSDCCCQLVVAYRDYAREKPCT